MHAERSTPNSIAAIIGIFLLALAVRVLVASPDACISKDGTWFIEMAHKLADEPVRHMQIETKQPGLSWMYLALGRLTGHMDPGTAPIAWQALGVWIAVLCGSAVCLLIFELTRQLFDLPTAIIASIFAALWPQGVELSTDALSDQPHLLLYLGVILTVGILNQPLQRRKLQLGLLFLTGIVAGLAYWVRLEAIGLLPAVFCWCAWQRAVTKKMRWHNAAAFAAGFLIPFLAFAAVTGRLLFVKTPTLSMLGLEFGRSDWILANAFPLWQTPGRILEAWAKSGRYVFAPLCVIALFWSRVPRGAAQLQHLFGWIVLWHLLLVFARVSMHGELSTRYLLIPGALTIPWAAAGLRTIALALMTRYQRTRPTQIIAATTVALLVVLTPMVPYLLRPINATRMPYRDAGLWLAQHAAPNDIIIATSAKLKQARFYAGRMYPNGDGWRIGTREGSKTLAQQVNGTSIWFIDYCEDVKIDAAPPATSSTANGPAANSNITFRSKKTCITVTRVAY